MEISELQAGADFARKLGSEEFEAKTGPESAQGALWPFVDKQFVPHLPTGWIQVWDQNPRKVFNEAALSELADSIAADGVQQPIVVRLIGVVGQGNQRHPVLQIVMGERRLRASHLADRPTIPAIVRVGLSDKDALSLAVVENFQRRNLNAVDEAGGFRALLEAGFSQVEIAQRIGASEAVISNRLRLLQLPSEVLALVRSGELGVSHALALLRYAAFPNAVTRIAQTVIKHKVTSHSLEAKMPSRLLLSESADDTTITRLNGYDLLNSCRKTCPFGALVEDEYSYGYCLNPAHIPTRQAEINAALLQEEADQKAALEQSKRTVQMSAQPPVPLLANDTERLGVNGDAGRDEQSSPMSPARVAAPAPLSVEAIELDDSTDEETIEENEEDDEETALPAIPPAGVWLHDLARSAYNDLRYSTCPSACTSACDCRGVAYNSDGEPVAICTDRTRFGKLQSDEKAAETLSARTAMKERIERIGNRLEKPSQAAYEMWTSAQLQEYKDGMNRAMAVIAFNLLCRYDSVSIAAAKAAGVEIAEKDKAGIRDGTLTYELCSRLSRLSPEGLLALSVDVLVRSELKSQLDWHFNKPLLTDFIEGIQTAEPEPVQPPAVPDGEPLEQQSEEDTVVEVILCTECGQEISQEALHTPVVDEDDLGQTLESGVYVFKSEAGAEPLFMCAVCAEIETSLAAQSAFTPMQRVEVALSHMTGMDGLTMPSDWQPAIVRTTFEDVGLLAVRRDDVGVIHKRIRAARASLRRTWRSLDMVRALQEVPTAPSAEMKALPTWSVGDVVEVCIGGVRWEPCTIVKIFQSKISKKTLFDVLTANGNETTSSPEACRPATAAAEALEDPACGVCGERRAEIQGKCRTCLEAEAESGKEAICKL